jgi:glycosyltransferase 2 family protein
MRDDEVTARPRPRSKPAWKRSLVGIVISIGCLAFIAWNIDLQQVRIAIANFKWIYLMLGMASLAVGYCLRIARWSMLLRSAGSGASFRTCAAPFLGSVALNNVLPFRMGDVIRVLVFPSAIGVGRAVATSSVVMERLVDLVTLLACLGIGVALSSGSSVPTWIADGAVALSIVGGASLAIIFFLSASLARWFRNTAQGNSVHHPVRARLMATLANLLAGFQAMSRLPVLFGLFTVSMLIWLGEAGLFGAVLRGFALDASIEAALAVMAVATLSTLVPSSPGYIGPFHLAAFAAVSMLGGTREQAASVAVLSHFAVWFPTTLAGAVAIFINPKLFAEARFWALSRSQSMPSG